MHTSAGCLIPALRPTIMTALGAVLPAQEISEDAEGGTPRGGRLADRFREQDGEGELAAPRGWTEA